MPAHSCDTPFDIRNLAGIYVTKLSGQFHYSKQDGWYCDLEAMAIAEDDILEVIKGAAPLIYEATSAEMSDDCTGCQTKLLNLCAKVGNQRTSASAREIELYMRSALASSTQKLLDNDEPSS